MRADLSELLREVRLETLEGLPLLEAAIKAEAERVLAAEASGAIVSIASACGRDRR
mgnify:FL=1